jgi:hypothetical protein
MKQGSEICELPEGDEFFKFDFSEKGDSDFEFFWGC